jgi:hypothetical protein
MFFGKWEEEGGKGRTSRYFILPARNVPPLLTRKKLVMA